MANEIALNLSLSETYASTTVQSTQSKTLSAPTGGATMLSATVDIGTSAAVISLGALAVITEASLATNIVTPILGQCQGLLIKFNGTGTSDTTNYLIVGLDSTALVYSVCALLANGPGLFLPNLLPGSTNTAGLPYVKSSAVSCTYTLTAVS